MVARLHGDAHVFERGDVGQDIGDLVGARDTLARNPIWRQAADILASKNNAPGGRPQHTRQAIEKGALAGTVRSDNGADLAPPHFEVDGIQRRQTSEAHREGFRTNDRVGSASRSVGNALSRRRRSLRQTYKPAGRPSSPSE